jgi:ABC-type multidrug transport system fused ATPase/permease subunit
VKKSSISDDVVIARKIWGLLTPIERRNAVGLLGLMFVGMVLEMLGIGLVIPAVALLIQPDFVSSYPSLYPVLEALGNPSQRALVMAAMLALVGVYVFKTAFLGFLAWRQMSFAFGIEAELSQRLFTVYLHQPYTFHLQRNSAQLIRNTVNEVNILIFSVIIPSMSLVTEALVFPSLCVLLLVFEPLGALIVVAVLGTSAWGSQRLTRRRIGRWGEVRQHHEGLRIQHVQQGLGGAKDVKLLGREAAFQEQYAVHTEQCARAGQLQLFLQQLPRLWLELLAAAGLAILLLAMLAQGRDFSAILPLLGLFAMAAFRLMPSISRVLSAFQSLRYGVAVVNTLHDELALAVPPTNRSGTAIAPFSETLELDRVTYTYPGAHTPAIRDLSLVIRRGESVGFIGPSGAGKSTLVDVLLGLLAPESGEVRVDGRDIQRSLRGWQDQIGYVPQSIFLTDDTLRRNVAFGLAEGQIDDAAVRNAIRAAQLEEFVRTLPQGLETSVGERGVRLSGGQRQRIGIARALYHDPAILVLDEASSSLDTATEREVMEEVRALRGAKTILIVSHRFSTVEHCDRLYCLARGRIVATGPPQTMLATTVRAHDR